MFCCCFNIVVVVAEMMDNMWLDGAIQAIKALAFVCDILTYPVFLLLQRPWEKKRLSRKPKVR